MDISLTCLLKTQKKELDFQILQKSKIYIKSDNDPTEKTESLFELRVTWWKVL